MLCPQPFSNLTAYDGKEVPQYGTTEILCSVNDTDYTLLQFYVCESNGPVILGLDNSCKLELINWQLKSQCVLSTNLKSQSRRHNQQNPTRCPTTWLSSLAFARKQNKLHICLRPRDLNANLQRNNHRAPTVEEITHESSGATVFSKLHAKNGYWSIILDESFSMLTTFNSPNSHLTSV